MAAERGRPPGGRGTLRLRITALAVAIVVVVLTVTAVVLVSAEHRLLEARLEEGVADRANELLTEIGDADTWPPRLVTTADPDFSWQLMGAGGGVLEASTDLAGAPPIARVDSIRDGVPVTAGQDADGFPYRLITHPVPSPDGTATLLVAADLEDILASTATLTRLLVVAIPMVAAILAVLVWWLVGRTLDPVEAIRAEVARIGGASLDRRVPQPPGDDEIARLARTMNAMLDRIRVSTERQRRFVADASHELRTPLTRIRTRLEVELTHPDGSDPRLLLGETLAEAVRLQVLVADLLELARADDAADSGPREPLDLDDLVLAAADRVREGGRRRVDATGVTAASVTGDRTALARAIGNLVDNAERHAASTVTLTLREDGGLARLVVADDGPGVPASERERIFERFARLDDARGRDAGGTGLGLAITREIVEAHGGSVWLDGSGGTGARFILTLPITPD